MIFRTLLACAILQLGTGYTNETTLLKANESTELVEPDKSTNDTETSVETPTTPVEPEITEPTTPDVEEEPTTPNIPTPEDVKDEAMELLNKWLSPEAVAIISTWGTLVVLIIYLAIKHIFLKKKNVETTTEVKKAIMDKLDDSVATIITEKLDKVIPEILANLNTQTDTLKTFAKILCLAQENTPESRVAILKLIEDLGIIEKANIETSKKVIEEKKVAEAEQKAKVKADLDKVIEETSNDDGTTI